MNGASKILTVSYGTFSCTLEGFDDPFNTMKAIAEYFRDLAAEDRYFGAEPPTPDAAMLHRIAEREIQRRVEAKIQDNGVVLRAEPGVTPKVTMPSRAAPDPVAAAQPAPVLSTAAEAAPAVESAALRLSRLRAAQAQGAAVASLTTARPAVTSPAVTSPSFIDAYADEVEALPAAQPTPDAAETARKQAEADMAAEKARIEAEEAAADAALRQRIAAEQAAEEAARIEAEAAAAEAARLQAEADRQEALRAEAERVAAEAADAALRQRIAEEQAAEEAARRAAAEEAQRAAKAEQAAAAEAARVEAEAEAARAAEVARLEAEAQAARAAEAEAARAAAEAEKAAIAERKAARKVRKIQPAAAAAESAAAALPTAADDATLSQIAAAIAETPAAPVVAAPVVAAPVVAAVVAPAEVEPEAALDALAASIRETLAGLTSADDQLAADMADASAVDVTAFPEAAWVEEEDFQPELDALADPAPTLEPELTSEPGPASEDQAASAEVASEQTPEAAAETAPETTPEPAPVATLRMEPEVVISAPVVAEKLQRARARVIKIRRLDPAAAATADTTEAAAPAAEAAPLAEAAPTPAPEPVALSPEAEAALQDELAALEAELSTAPAAPQAETPLAQPGTDLALGEARRLSPAQTDDAAVNRLLEKANSELEVPETKRRRSAIAHLKAAVLATVAERRINPNGRKPDLRADPYRKDLDQVVRPAERPMERPAPLVLVSSQRIDRKPADAGQTAQPALAQPVAPQQPIRPRRISTGSAQALAAPLEEEGLSPEAVQNVFAENPAISFQDFADQIGAHSMQDLIEAAGAYCTIVLGLDSFSRPQLFQQIESLPGQEEINREDSLRGFGRLLRDGRLAKTKRGQYVLDENSPILTRARRNAS